MVDAMWQTQRGSSLEADKRWNSLLDDLVGELFKGGRVDWALHVNLDIGGTGDIGGHGASAAFTNNGATVNRELCGRLP